MEPLFEFCSLVGFHKKGKISGGDFEAALQKEICRLGIVEKNRRVVFERNKIERERRHN